MPASAADMEWLERALRDYLADKEAALDDAMSKIGGVGVFRDALDDWAYRTEDPHGVCERTVFVSDRLLAGQSITPDALDAAWPGRHIPPPDKADLAELPAASALGEGMRDRLASFDEADLEAAMPAAGGMEQVQAALTRWASGHDPSDAADGMVFILDRVVAGQPIDPGSLEAAWHAR